MRVELRLDQISSNWSLRVLESTHNYRPSIAATAYSVHRHAALISEACATISTLLHTGLQPRQILTILRSLDLEIGLSLVPRDIYNFTQKARLEELDGRTLIQWL
jgi:hypothetical protein